MASALDTASAFARTTHQWLVKLDPAGFKDEGIPEAREGLEAVRDAAELLFAALGPTAPEALYHVAHELDALREALPHPGEVPDERTAWLDLRVALSPLYEAFALAVKRAGGKAKHLHPTNLKRSFVHLVSGLLVVACFELVFTQWTGFLTATAFVLWAWPLEAARRVSPTVNRWCMAFFGPIARDHERYRINSATWYGSALWVLSVSAYGPAGVLGLLALAVGDPLAGLVGRTYGSTRIWGGKSLEGTFAFAVASMAVGYLYLIAFHLDLAGSFTLLGLAALAGVTGAVVELASTRLEDNFTIPVLTAWVCQVAILLLT
ncbi:MAG: hypothetical protein H6734_24295 [Alphaproteobacteria bacterium]|nr:hypothetical protein [Alphaproteobacteria bacterium]